MEINYDSCQYHEDSNTYCKWNKVTILQFQFSITGATYLDF